MRRAREDRYYRGVAASTGSTATGDSSRSDSHRADIDAMLLDAIARRVDPRGSSSIVFECGLVRDRPEEARSRGKGRSLARGRGPDLSAPVDNSSYSYVRGHARMAPVEPRAR